MTLPDLDLSRLDSRAIRGLPNDQLGLVLQETLRLFETDRRENQIFFYKPTSEPVLELFSTDRKVIALGGGNGSGKTENALVYIIALATGMIPDSVTEDMKPKFKGPLKCRVVVESLTTTLHPIILPKLKWWVWTGAGQQGGDQGHWGWIPKMCLIDGSWEKSWSEKLRMLRLVCRNPDNTDEVMGESSIQFMCLRGDQRVLMANGTWLEIEKIVEGDRVFVPEQGGVFITKTFKYEAAPMLRVRCEGGREIVSTPNHKHQLVDGSFLAAEDLTPGDLLAVYEDKSPGGYPVDEWKMGWLAIMIGDGYIKGRQASFAAKPPSRVLDDLPPMPPGCKLHEAKAGIEWRVTLDGPRRGNPLVALLRETGLWGLGSVDKFVPDLVFRANPEGRAYFLKHLWHTDGTVNQKGRQAVYRSISKRLAYDVKYLLWSLGIPAAVGEADGLCGFTGKRVHSYHTCVSGGGFDRFTELMAGGPLKSGGAWMRKTPGKVVSVEDAGEGDVYCIEVADWRHTFICDGLVTHNSHDQDPSDFASGDFNIVLHDEPPSQAIWRENEARTMRVDGTMMLSMTWPDDPTIPVDWIYDEVYDRRDENVCWIELHTTQNPHLNQEAIARQMASWSEEMRQVRIFGQPIRFSNRIHSAFTDTTAFWSLSQGKTVAADTVDDDIVAFNHVQGFDNPPNWPCIWLLDPHPRKPHMFMWVQVDPSDDLWVIAEGKCDGDPAAVARHVEGVEYDMGLLVRARLIDPNMGRSPASTKRGVTWQDEFDAARLYCELADDNLGVGIRRINDYLVPDSRTRRPRLHIHSRCRDTIFQIKRYVWEDYRRKDERDLKNKPRDKNDDFPTLLRYCLNYEPRFSQLHDGAVIMQRPGHRRGAY